MVRCRLPLLSLEETQEYIASRLTGAGGSGSQAFPAETVQTIYSYARGVPRLVNLLCEQALIGAYADRSTIVSSANVRRVAAEFDLVGEPFRSTSLDAKFTPKFSTNVPSASESIAHTDAPGAAEVPAAPEIPEIEKTMAAAAAEAAAPVAQARHSASIAESVPVQPVPDSVVLSDGKTPAQAAFETPELETVVTAMRSEPAPAVVAEDPAPASHEEHALHIVPHRDKGQPAREYTWRKHRAESAFAVYWRDVAVSFVRDWRAFFASFAPQVSAFAGNVPHRADSLRRKVIAPLRAWLRTPINPDRRRDADSTPPRSRVDKP
jgi:hypothetical protein